MARTGGAKKAADENATVAEPTARWVCETLDVEYGELVWRSHGEPLDALVQTILSQATSDINSERAFDSLRRAFPGGWDDVRVADVLSIRDAIKSGGLADAKAPRIQAVLQAIYEETGRTDLEFLKTMETGAAKEFLSSFHGVGPKTVACVMMFSLGRPVLPVDTHVFRVSHRLGLIDKKIGEAKAHGALEAQLPPERVYPFHVHLIRHGRKVCVAQGPRCGACVLSERCEYRRANPGGVAVARPAREKIADTAHGMRLSLKETRAGGSNESV